MPSKKPSMIEAMRAKHDPHYKLASKVAGLQDAGEKVDNLEKDVAVKLGSLHKTLSKSFAMQRKALMRIAGVEGRIKNLETGVEIWTNREADRNKNRDTSISNLTDVVIQALGDIREGKAGKAGAAGASGLDGGSGLDGLGGAAGTSGVDGTSGLDGLDGGSGSDGAGGINGDSFLGADNYEKYSTELQQSGTIAGRQLSPQERKEGFKKRKNKVDFKKFVGKVVSKKGGPGGSGNGKKTALGKDPVVPGTKGGQKDVDDISKDPEADAEAEGDKAKIDEDKKDPRVEEILNFLNTVLDSSLTKIENNLEKILGNFEDQIDANKDKGDALKDDASDDKLADREAKLEGGGKQKSIMAKAADKVVEPVQGLFQTILNFITNVLLGGIVMKVLDIISNPLKLLDPFINIINGVSIALNAVIKAVHWIATRPLALLRSAFNLGINIWTKAINKALKLLPMVDFQIPEFVLPEIPGAPQIPMIPSGDEVKSKLSGEAPAVQGMAGGGIVTNVTNFLPGYSEGGKVKTMSEELGHTRGTVTDPKEKARIEAETLHWVNKEREFLGLPPLDKISYADGVELTKPMGKEFYGAGITEESSDDWDFNTMTRTTSKWKQRGSEIIFEGAHEQITPEQKQAYFDSNPVARMARDLKEQAELDDLGASISASAKMNGGGLVPLSYFNKGGKVPGSGTGDTVPAMLTPGQFVMSKGAVQKVGVENLMQMNAAGGGTNQPTLMKVKGYAGGGMVEPGPPSGGQTKIVGAPAGGGGGGGDVGGSAGDRPGVTRFSSTDHRNPSTLVVKSIYNVVQG